VTRLLLVAGGAAVALLFVTSAGRWLVVRDPLPARADAIVIMAGGIGDRSLEAADLYRAGVAPKVVVTRERIDGGTLRLRARGVRLPESHDLLRLALESLGVPASAIVDLHRRNRSTESEARTIARWACAHRVTTLVVVTSRSHSRRARMILARALGPGIRLSMQPSRHDTFAASRWWRVRHAAKTVLSEYQKLANHWLGERWRMEPCGGLRRVSSR
jgi:uncharacterized SAM-binding protein YcdF (DUF218 family)